MTPFEIRSGFALIALCGFCACGGTPPNAGEGDSEATATKSQALGSTQLAYSIPSGLVASTGNLYWTSYEVNEFGPDSATVWRASKNNTPGAETVLYRESGEPAPTFGSITYANVGGQYYGYFVANYERNGAITSQIKRIPLTGGSATVLATSPAPIQNRDLLSDGSTLFWADAEGLRSMPIAGGSVKILLWGAGEYPHLALDNSFVYWSNSYGVARISKDGNTTNNVVSTRTPVATFHLDTYNGQPSNLFWAENAAAVYAKQISTWPITTYQNPIAGRAVTSLVYVQYWYAAWTECAVPSHAQCTLKRSSGGSPETLASLGVGAGHLQWDPSAVYWGDSLGLHKHVF